MATRFDRIISSIPKYYKPQINRNWKGILTAISDEDTRIDTANATAREQLFVQTAVSQFLDMLGSNVGVARPKLVKFVDSVFRQLIPILSFYPKQVRPSIYAALQLFWPTSYMHSTVTASAFEPYNLVGGERLFLTVDRHHDINVTFRAEDFENPGAATAQEVVDRINSWLPEYVIAFVTKNNQTGKNFVSVATKTFGLAGTIQVTSGTANNELLLPTAISQYTKVSLHEIHPNELVVRIPKNLTVEFDDLRFAHRFHPDATIMDSRPLIDAAHPYWPGGFFYDRPNGQSPGISSTRAKLQTAITASNHYAVLTFDDVSMFPGNGGFLLFNFGKATSEKGIKYFQRINNTQLSIDATYAFQYSHIVNEWVNLMQLSPVVPEPGGTDYPIFFVDTGIAQVLTEYFLLLLKAAGIIVRIVFTQI